MPEENRRWDASDWAGLLTKCAEYPVKAGLHTVPSSPLRASTSALSTLPSSTLVWSTVASCMLRQADWLPPHSLCRHCTRPHWYRPSWNRLHLGRTQRGSCFVHAYFLRAPLARIGSLTLLLSSWPSSTLGVSILRALMLAASPLDWTKPACHTLRGAPPLVVFTPSSYQRTACRAPPACRNAGWGMGGPCAGPLGGWTDWCHKVQHVQCELDPHP